MITVSHLTKYYGLRKAVNNISFSVEAGQVIGLLGLNGAGKSTTMNIMAGCLSSTGGQVLIDGIDIEEEPEKAKGNIGYLPEIPPLYADMKVCEYLSFVYELKKAKQRRLPHLEEISGKTGIDGVYRRLIKNLSKGYRQRVGLAAALVGNPGILILDEPTVGLDPAQILEIRNLIKSFGRDHTVILSSHILSEIQAVCNRVIVLNKGDIAADDSPLNLLRTMRNYSSYIAVVEGEAEKVLQTLSAVNDVEEVKQLEMESENVYEYHISGRKERDIRKSVSAALSSGGFLLLNTKQEDVFLENVFIELINADRESEL